MYQTLQSERLYEQIVGQIEHRILTGELKVGDQLPAERELAQQFGVSRTAVREAIKALREKGLVQAQPGRGTFITDSASRALRHTLRFIAKVGSEEGLGNLVEVREMIEPEIAALAARRANDENIVALRDAVLAMDAAMQHADMFVEADLDFHLALADATQNPLIPALIDSIVHLLREQRKRLFLGGSAVNGQYHHKRILDAIVRHDADAARQAMTDHLHQIRADLERIGL